MEREHLLTLVDHHKPFKGTWEIYRDGEQHYTACHHANQLAIGGAQAGATAESCQELGGERQACAFTSQLQFHGWTIENHDRSCQDFRLACHL
ncbi:MAG: hypothetical protein ACK5N0_02095 [Synechococcaceae cyanobacterium]